MLRPRTAAGALALGVAAGAVLTVSPLSFLVLIGTAILLAAAGRGLPDDERRALVALLAVAMALRLAAILALDVASAAAHSQRTTGVIFGDESYIWGRVLRARDVFLQLPASKYDYQVIHDSYARTIYVSLLTWLQVMFGPSPYGTRALNALAYVAGTAVLYRAVRTAVGAVPALLALGMALFLPSLFLWSISLLKESLFFFLTASALAASAAAVHERRSPTRAATAALLAAACVYALSDLRPGAVVLTSCAVVIGGAAAWFSVTARRRVVAGLALAAGLAAIWLVPPVSSRAVAALTSTAKLHLGHVFTPGHSYKTLDDGFYRAVGTPASMIFTLDRGEAARYAARSAGAFLTVPLPWQIETRSELLFLPEQLLWYVLVVAAAAGVPRAWSRDAPTAAMFLAYAALMGTALALTNGNVGTLVRLRGLVVPFIVWFGALGVAVAMSRLLPDAAGQAAAR